MENIIKYIEDNTGYNVLTQEKVQITSFKFESSYNI